MANKKMVNNKKMVLKPEKAGNTGITKENSDRWCPDGAGIKAANKPYPKKGK